MALGNLDSRIEGQEDVIKWVLDNLHFGSIKKFKADLQEEFYFYKLKCTSCNRWLPPTQFSRNKQKIAKRYSWCKSCSYLIKLYEGKASLPPGILDNLPPHFIPKKLGLVGNKNRCNGHKKRHYKTKITIKRN